MTGILSALKSDLNLGLMAIPLINQRQYLVDEIQSSCFKTFPTANLALLTWHMKMLAGWQRISEGMVKSSSSTAAMPRSARAVVTGSNLNMNTNSIIISRRAFSTQSKIPE